MVAGEQCLTTTRRKTYKKAFETHIWVKWTKTETEFMFFCHCVKYLLPMI